MKKTSALLFFVLSFMFSGCSYMTDFYIYNMSLKPVSIKYTLKKATEDQVFIAGPKIYRKGKDNEQILITEPERIPVYDSISKTVTAVLQAQEILFIGQELNFALGNESDQESAFRNFDRLLIVNSSNDSITCSGAFVATLFTKTDKANTVSINVK